MSVFQNILFCVLSINTILNVYGDSTFAGSAVTSDSGGTRSVLVTGGNGVGIQTRFGGGGPALAGGPVGGPVGTYASAGGASAFAGPGGAYAGPGGAYAGPGPYGAPWGFPYWNDGGAYAAASAGAPYSYNYPPPYPYDPYYNGNYGNVYTGNDVNGIQTRIANVPPGGHATIVEQNGNEAPKVYTFRGPTSTSTKEVVAKIVS